MEKPSQKITNNKLMSFLLLALFFTLPFERIPTFEVGGFTVKISYILGVIFLVAMLLSRLWHLLRQERLSNSEWIFLSFWLFSLLGSLIFSPDIKRSLIILSLWAFMFLLYATLRRLVTIEIRENIYNVILFSSCLVCLFGLYQFIGDSFGLNLGLTGLRAAYSKEILGFPRIQSVALEPLYFANFLFVPFFLSIIRYIKSKGFFTLYFWTSVLILVSIILTVSRGAYIALGASFIVFFIYLILNRRRENYGGKLMGSFLIIVLSAVISFGLLYKLNGKEASNNFVDHSVVENVQADGSAFDRIGTYKLAFEKFKTNPIFGTGAGSFGVLTKSAEDKIGYGTVNNEYLEILSENGLIGLALFLSFLIAYMLEYKKRLENTDSKTKLMFVGIMLGILAILIQYNFFSTLYIIYFWVFLALAMPKGKDNVTI